MCARDGHIYHVSLLFFESQDLQKHFWSCFHGSTHSNLVLVLYFYLFVQVIYFFVLVIYFFVLQMGSWPDNHLLFILLIQVVSCKGYSFMAATWQQEVSSWL